MQCQSMFFQKFPGGACPQTPLALACTLLFNSHTLGRTYQKLLPPPLSTAGCIGGGNQVSPAKAGNPETSFLIRRVLLKHVLGAEHICEIRAFQDGGATHSQSSSSGSQLDGQNRSEGCLLYGFNSSSMP